MNVRRMSLLNDDGISLNLTTVLILFLVPNFLLIILTIFNGYLLYRSKYNARCNHWLGKLANFFSKGALDRIIRNILQSLEVQKRQNEEYIPMSQQRPLGIPNDSHTLKKLSASPSVNSKREKMYDANYLFLIPFQVDLLFTVFVYKILTRDVYFETCHSYLTTYHTRPTQVVCWLKHINKNISNWSMNVTLYEYCTNQTITYINYEHNDVMCAQYVFHLINIIDTVTNMFAWHQAVVFMVTKYIVFTHWYQQKLRKILRRSNLFRHHRHIILYIAVYFAVFTYILVFVIILPIRFVFVERRRVDLTHHLLYACAKFTVGIVVHVNLYTLYQWHLFITQKMRMLRRLERQKASDSPLAASNISIGYSVYASPSGSMTLDDHQLGTTPRIYLTPHVSI